MRNLNLDIFIFRSPLNNYINILTSIIVISFKKFILNDNNEGLVSGTLMSIQEKKSSKGTFDAIAKFSDKFGEFELFIFSEILVKNREILKEGSHLF